MAVGLSYSALAANVDYDYVALAELGRQRVWSDRSPAAAQTHNAYLVGISCPSVSRCIAVGQNVTSALAMGWDGSRWKIQLAPIAPPAMSILNGVACTSLKRCIAVGYITPNQSSLSHVLIERWDGRRWSIMRTPSISPFESAVLNGVACSQGSCTAVGALGAGQLIERWNGRKWSIQRTPPGTPDAVLNGVSCLSPAECVAVGGLTNGAAQSVAERWNGASWSIERTPRPAAGSLLNAISCFSATDCVAVGQRGHGPLLEHWNGTVWSIQRRS